MLCSGNPLVTLPGRQVTLPVWIPKFWACISIVPCIFPLSLLYLHRSNTPCLLHGLFGQGGHWLHHLTLSDLALNTYLTLIATTGPRHVCSQLVSLNLVHSMSTSFGSVSSQPLLILAAQNLLNSFVATFARPQPQGVLFLCIVWPLDKATYVASIIIFRMNTGDHWVQDQQLLLGHHTSLFDQLHDLHAHPTLSMIFAHSNMLKMLKTTSSFMIDPCDELSALEAESHQTRLAIQASITSGKGTEVAYSRHVKNYEDWWVQDQGQHMSEDSQWKEIPAQSITAVKVAIFLWYETTQSKVNPSYFTLRFISCIQI